MTFFSKSEGPTSKAYISTGTLPAYIEPHQPPTRKQPFTTILEQPMTHMVELLLPEELYDLVWQDVSSKLPKLEYARVNMSLSEVVDGDFFNRYIKSGNILMVSEGRPGVDNKYILKDGVLRLELAKAEYERCGLAGKPMRDMGRVHLKTRFSVELDLRQPSMLHGKKGFERIVWAFKNVLNRSVTWLFHDLERHEEGKPRPIAQHHPLEYDVKDQRSNIEAVLTPSLELMDTTSTNADFEDWALDFYEWLSLLSIQSPRVQASDTIDPFLSRYRVPANDDQPASQRNMVRLSWKALVPAAWNRDLFITLNDLCSKTPTTTAPKFFALSAHALKTETQDQLDGYTILWLPERIVETPAEASHEDKKQKRTHATRQGNEFVLFRLCQNSLY